MPLDQQLGRRPRGWLILNRASAAIVFQATARGKTSGATPFQSRYIPEILATTPGRILPAEMKKVAWGLAVGVVAVPLAFLGRATATRGPEEAPGGEVVRVTRRTIASSVKATGVVKPRIGAEVRVGSRVSGVVARLHVQIGETVARGQLLAELETRELVARRDQAQAALAAADATLQYARSALARQRALATADLLSAADLDVAERSRGVAEQQSAEAAANLDFARTQLGYSRIWAPIGGIVASVATQEGETVAASLAAPTFVTLVDLARLEVWAYVDETDIGRIARGQRARFTVDTYPDHEFEGRVTAVYPQAEIRDNVVNYVTVVTFDPPRDRTLRPEMTTTVRIAIDTRENVLAVPRRAVRREQGRTFVLTPAREKRWVTAGSRDEADTEIVAGLREGDEVLVGDSGGPAKDAH
jgi:RND family efflux transporter MFP subunit